jgi:hypothetical protein
MANASYLREQFAVHDLFIVSTRDPLSRTISAFNFEHPIGGGAPVVQTMTNKSNPTAFGIHLVNDPATQFNRVNGLVVPPYAVPNMTETLMAPLTYMSFSGAMPVGPKCACHHTLLRCLHGCDVIARVCASTPTPAAACLVTSVPVCASAVAKAVPGLTVHCAALAQNPHMHGTGRARPSHHTATVAPGRPLMWHAYVDCFSRLPGGINAFAEALDQEGACGTLARRMLHDTGEWNHMNMGYEHLLDAGGLLKRLAELAAVADDHKRGTPPSATRASTRCLMRATHPVYIHPASHLPWRRPAREVRKTCSPVPARSRTVVRVHS